MKIKIQNRSGIKIKKGEEEYLVEILKNSLNKDFKKVRLILE